VEIDERLLLAKKLSNFNKRSRNLIMKRCTKDNLEFSDDRHFCSRCGATLVEEFEMVTLMMPKMKMNDDLTFLLSIRDRIYKLSMDEIRTIAAEACATVKTAERRLSQTGN
jgi:hypothetical protein